MRRLVDRQRNCPAASSGPTRDRPRSTVTSATARTQSAGWGSKRIREQSSDTWDMLFAWSNSLMVAMSTMHADAELELVLDSEASAGQTSPFLHRVICNSAGPHIWVRLSRPFSTDPTDWKEQSENLDFDLGVGAGLGEEEITRITCR
ncbi:hypothetical protein GUJ93_ZPchr0008g12094 [Zizania palustris]|uniref:Uncharacterized protein n=1 Tax=Zizania palustris TaxID=103762 RepID=A0A8J5REA4_ZIZPA|nr:hypothetical protein GUJ93_ZPchr0008g12094 [Zizania palustris]